MENQRAVGIQDIPVGPVLIARAVKLGHSVDSGDGAILGAAPARARAAVRNAQLDGDIERGAIDAGLAAANDFLDDHDGTDRSPSWNESNRPLEL